MSSEDAKPVNGSAIAEKTPVSRPSIYGLRQKVFRRVRSRSSVFSDQMRVFSSLFTVHSKILPTSPIPHFPIPFKQDLVLACINISDCIVKFS
jgi:hypothetical protein